MRLFILIDIYNLYFRAMHSINAKEPFELQEGMLFHTMIYMIKKACDKFNPDHLIVCSDCHGNWRKEIYNGYKMNRLDRLQDRTPAEVIREARLKEIFEGDFLPFIKDKTNVSFLTSPKAEADDMIARFISLHPNDRIIIMSTDNDFVQLLSDNVIIFNSMDDRIITNKCLISSANNQPLKFKIKDGKISVSKTDCLFSKNDTQLVPMNDWVEYALFSKCIRGDKSDNIFSAYPGIREKSTKKTIGMLDAFADRNDKGYNWQTFMNSVWENPLGEKKVVKECYDFNKKIIDLSKIPEELKVQFDKDIMEALNKEPISHVGFNVAKFLQKWKLDKLLSIIQNFSAYFSKEYPK